MNRTYDFLVIGAGPAGMAAAATAAKLGVATLLLDEQPDPGGQIYRGIESRGQAGVEKPGVSQADSARGLRLTQEFRASSAAYQAATQVWQLEAGGKVYVTNGERASCISARRVLLATGAMERPVPLPGWTLPGVMTVGAAQILYKTSQWLPPEATWIAGSGPLLWLYAAQVIEAGGPIAGILDTTPKSNYAHALRYTAGALRNRAYLDRGMALQKMVRKAGVRIVKDVSAVEVKGEGHVSTIRYHVGGHWREETVAMLLLHQGVVPNVHATRSLGAKHRWDALQRSFAPEVDAWGNLGVEGYAAAGDCVGIVGAEASAVQGKLAALEAARAIGVITQVQRDVEAAPLQMQLTKHLPVRPFLDQLFAPRASLLAPRDDVLVCRCESITARQLRDAVGLGAMGPNQVKAFTRCGMGPCQGRLCGLAAAEVIAAARGVGMAETGVFNVRPPLKPVSLGELAGLEV